MLLSNAPGASLGDVFGYCNRSEDRASLRLACRAMMHGFDDGVANGASGSAMQLTTNGHWIPIARVPATIPVDPRCSVPHIAAIHVADHFVSPALNERVPFECPHVIIDTQTVGTIDLFGRVRGVHSIEFQQGVPRFKDYPLLEYPPGERTPYKGVLTVDVFGALGIAYRGSRRVDRCTRPSDTPHDLSYISGVDVSIVSLRFRSITEQSTALDSCLAQLLVNSASQVAGGPHLVHIDINWSPSKNLDDDVVAMVQRHPSITHIRYRLTDSVVMRIADFCPALTALDIHAGEVTDAGVEAIVVACPQLTSIGVGGQYSEVSDEAICAVAAHCPRLKTLDVSLSHGRITDIGITSIAQQCPDLTQLDVCLTSGKVTDAGIEAVAHHCPRLTRLNVSATDGAITDAGLLTVSKYCPHLEVLDVSFTEGQVSEAGIEAVVLGCASLVLLDAGYGLWSRDFLQKLRSTFPALRVSGWGIPFG
jgi:hypothetical protein